VPATTQHTRSRAARLVIVLIQLAVLAAVVVVVVRYQGTREAEGATVPELVGHNREVAAAILDVEHLRVRWKAVGGGRAGQVVGQVPPAGEEVSRGHTVVVSVARGPQRRLLPDVTRLSATRAHTRLRRAGFRVESREEPSATARAGMVASTTPPPFSRVAPRARVILLVSTGVSREVVPRVRGALLPAARRRLLRLRMGVVVTERQSARKVGTVLAQTPRPGARVRRGAVVRLVVATAIPRVRVPRVVGEPQQRAATAISSRGLALAFAGRPVRRAARVGVVVAQAPRAGRRVDRGSKVTLTVGRPKASKPRKRTRGHR
jgi:beta-lactam-binding protein with PASTA domain